MLCYVVANFEFFLCLGIVVSRDASAFVKNIVIMGFISLLASICSGLRGGFFMVAIQKFNIRVRNSLFKSITSQEIGFFDNVKTGKLKMLLPVYRIRFCNQTQLKKMLFV